MPDLYERASAGIAEIEAEMKAIGCWSGEPLPESAYRFKKAFAMDTMAFTQWLQFIFVPRVRQIVAERGRFPDRSVVAAQAYREFDGEPDASRLISLLADFDRLFDGKAD